MSIYENDLKQLLKAIAFSARKHRDQRRKDIVASPYINHPISLADILCNEGHVTDTEVICSAILHDTVEDTDTTIEELEQEFGTTISGIVSEVTDDKNLDKAERKQRQIDHSANISNQAKLVKLADKISNLRDVSDSPPENWSLERKQAYFDWANLVIDQLRGVHTPLENIFDHEYARRP